MKLRLETGHPVTKDVKEVASDRVRFVAEDGRTMFEVIGNKDGRSLEVRAVDTCKVDGILYAGTLEIVPKCGNVVIVRTEKYDR